MAKTSQVRAGIFGAAAKPSVVWGPADQLSQADPLTYDRPRPTALSAAISPRGAVMQLGDGSPRAQVDEAGKGVQLALDVGAAGRR